MLRPSVLGEPFLDRLARTAPGKIVVHVEQTAGLQAWPKQLELSGRALVPVGVEAQHADFLGQACCAQRVLHFAFDVAHALVVPIAKYASHVALHVAERAKVPLSGGRIDEVDSKARRNMPSVVRRIPLLFGAIADTGLIRELKNGSSQMKLEGIESINWFTDRPQRVQGLWKPKKLMRQWDKYFATSQPNAQVTVQVGEYKEIWSFEMFKPRIKSGNMIFNVRQLIDSGEDKLTGQQHRKLSDISLFIDSATPGRPSCFPDCISADLRGLDMSGQRFVGEFDQADFSPKGETRTNLTGAIMPGADMTNAKLNGAKLNYANLNSANLTDAHLNGADLTGANLWKANLLEVKYDPTTTWPAPQYWNETTCPNGTNSVEPGNATCGFKA